MVWNQRISLRRLALCLLDLGWFRTLWAVFDSAMVVCWSCGLNRLDTLPGIREGHWVLAKLNGGLEHIKFVLGTFHKERYP